MIHLNFQGGRPIYEQVKDGLRHLVVTGALQPGDQFPSVRTLASTLAINPNTIQRAYESLESEGYLSTAPGKGSFAALCLDRSAPRRETLLSQLDNTATELFFLGLSPEELARRIYAAAGREKEDRP